MLLEDAPRSCMAFSCVQTPSQSRMRPGASSTGLPAEAIWMFSFFLSLSRTRRINTAGHIPKEAVSINRDMVRTHTFDIEDFERIIARPVRLLAILSKTGPH